MSAQRALRRGILSGGRLPAALRVTGFDGLDQVFEVVLNEGDEVERTQALDAAGTTCESLSAIRAAAPLAIPTALPHEQSNRA